MKVVDYLAKEIIREGFKPKEATKTRKAGKRERIAKLVVSLQAKAESRTR